MSGKGISVNKNGKVTGTSRMRSKEALGRVKEGPIIGGVGA